MMVHVGNFGLSYWRFDVHIVRSCDDRAKSFEQTSRRVGVNEYTTRSVAAS
jgi:hypothetical protein